MSMKSNVLVGLVGAVLALTIPVKAAADDTVYATITSVTPNYIELVTPVRKNICSFVDVPIYDTVQGQGATGLEVLGGAIIGGLFGKAITDKDEGAAAGAVIGGVVAAEAGRADKTRIIGYEKQKRCGIQFVDRVESVVDNYTIYYQWKGQYGSTVVDKRYRIGDKVMVMVIITMLSGQ